MAKQKKVFIWKYVQEISSLAGIISFLISVLIFLGINNIKDILSEQSELLDITLNESSIIKIPGKSITIDGFVLLKESNKSALSYLILKNIDLYPIARSTVPLSKWRVYPRPIIKNNGELFFTIDLSYFSTKDSSNAIQVILISCAHDLLSEGFEFQNLLPYLNISSNMISIRYY